MWFPSIVIGVYLVALMVFLRYQGDPDRWLSRQLQRGRPKW